VRGGVLDVMAADLTDILTLSEQLDAMLLGWLEHAAERRGEVRPDLRATAILTIPPRTLPELQLLCERWHLTIEMRESVAVIGGPARVVDGLVAVAGMYRR
jgi:hypothetical protein